MKRFFTFFTLILLTFFSIAKTWAQVTVGGACPPITANSVVVTPFLVTATSGCPTVPEVQLLAPTQYNSYFLYLYAGGNASGTPLSTVELIGTTTGDLLMFGDAMFTSGATYTVKAVPFSTNLGLLTAQALAPTTFTYPQAASPASNARGSVLSPNSPFINCGGIIDVNIVTRTTSPWNCVLPSNIGVFKTKLFGGDKPEPITLQTAGIRLLVTPSTPVQCLTDDAFLHDLYTRWSAGNKILFRYKDPATSKEFYCLMGAPTLPLPGYTDFVTKVQSLWSSSLIKYFTDNNQYLFLEVTP